MQCCTRVHQLIMRTAVFDCHDDEMDVTSIWKSSVLTLMLCPPMLLRTHGFRNNQLHVNSQARFAWNPMETVSCVVLYLLTRRKFDDTRFCSVGGSMREVLASLACRANSQDKSFSTLHTPLFAWMGEAEPRVEMFFGCGCITTGARRCVA